MIACNVMQEIIWFFSKCKLFEDRLFQGSNIEFDINDHSQSVLI